MKKTGLIYEYLDKAGPMAVNSMPMFFSCKLLSKPDTKKMFEFYEEYIELQKKFKE